ncbi:MAG: TRAP transporter large permease [Syntrophaceae bacterium]|nr:TRAP transporter large permease [Syntrophaceae bacterium]
MYSFLFLMLILFALLVAGQRIAFALGTVAVIAILTQDLSLPLMAQTLYGVMDNFIWAAIPLFILMGSILFHSGIAHDIYNSIYSWVKHIPGGLAVATILTCAFFAAVSGTSLGTVAALGGITVPAMIEKGYDKKFAYGTIACGGTLGILIPPSITMIIYGVITETSVEKLFLAGVIPGIILTLLFSIYCMIYSWKYQKGTIVQPASWKERWRSSRKSLWGISVVVIIMGGIYSGFFTVTESAGVGAAYALFVGIVVYRKINLKALLSIIQETTINSVMIFTIVAFAMCFGSAINMMQIPQQVTEVMISFQMPHWLTIILLNIILIFMGDFLDVPSIMLITLPIFFPTILRMGYDPLWFAVLLTMNMELATITPPVGLNVYVLHGVLPDSKVSEILKGCVPFFMIIILCMVIVGLVPGLSTWLPSLTK